MTQASNDKSKGHAIALFSGGLDSALAIMLMLKQNIRVTALTFMTHFGCDLSDRSSCGSDPYPMAEKFGFDVKLMHLGQKFIDIVENPRYGRGKNMNVCTDCRILMLTEARKFMEIVKADFVVTGEVLGQRPMSQVRNKLNLTEKQSGLRGRLLRPLSAKLCRPTQPELSGMVDREQLEAIQGRGRKRQLEMAAEFGLEDYPTPASGCLLTDVGYSNRLRDLLAHTERLSFDDLNLLKVGRHFRLDKNTKIVVGRNQADNEKIMSCRRPHHVYLEALGVGSPVTLLIGDATEENVRKAATITARYCAAKRMPQVEITAREEQRELKLVVEPARDVDLSYIAVN
ncbi:MAG: hypothetical protein JSU74_04310 [Candidatus Zixiibacteriota bacterium]|nr:MAG: hypothetical protein JSU74_04310 [candidate division Zixibacteria bacterium]